MNVRVKRKGNMKSKTRKRNRSKDEEKSPHRDLKHFHNV
jgi:hypothetical protein